MRRNRRIKQKTASLDHAGANPVESKRTDLQSAPGKTDVRSAVGYVLVYGVIFSAVFLRLMDPLVPLQRLPSPEEIESLTGVFIPTRPVEYLFGFEPRQFESQVAVSSAFGLGVCFLSQLMAKTGSLMRSA